MTQNHDPLRARGARKIRTDEVHLQRDELRDHDRFVSALARRLVRDPDLAADTAQDAWTVALSRERPAHVSLRAWLAGILRNRVRSDRRDAARRREFHARIAKREEESPSSPGPADDLVARTEMEQRVLRAVLELEEPIRDAVLLRFREGRSSAQIGRALDIPDGTARWRIHRGITLVREQLDREHDGDREAWMPGVALIAGGGGAWTAPIIGGILAMNGKAVLSGIAIIAVAAGLWMTEDSGRPDNSANTEFVADTSVPDRPNEEAEKGHSSPASDTARAPVSTEPPVGPKPILLKVQGRCITPDGSPLEGVTIAFASRQHAKQGWPSDRKPREGDETDSDGSFSIDIPIEENVDNLRPWIVDRSGAPEQILRFTREGRIPRIVSTFETSKEGAYLGDVVLRPGATVRGRVMDEFGRPIAQATVYAEARIKLSPLWRDHGLGSAPHRGVISDPSGRFVLAGIAPGWIRVFADREGYFIGASDPLGVGASGNSDDVIVVLPSTGSRIIEGVALDASGIPLANVKIHHQYQVGRNGFHGQIDCDDRGRFSVRSFHLTPHSFTLRHEGSSAKSEGVLPGRLDVELRIADPRKATIYLLDTVTGLPITSYSGSVQSDGFYASFPEEDHPDGRATIAVGENPFTIHVGARGYLKNQSGPIEPTSIPAEIIIPLTPSPALKGLVLRAGVPVEGAEINIVDANDVMELWGFPVRSLRSFDSKDPIRSEVDGSFALRVRNIEARFFLRASFPGLAPAEAGPFRWPEGPFPNPIVMELTDGGSIAGEVLVPAGRSPAGILVVISRGDGSPIATRTDSLGKYRFEHLTPGPWQVELRPNDYDAYSRRGSAYGLPDDTPIPSNCIVDVGRTTLFNLSLRAEERSRLTGTALRSGARPGLSVSLYDCADSSRWSVTPGKADCHESRDLRGKRQASATVMADGTYSLTVTKPGTYVAVLSDHALEGVAGSEVETLVELVPGQTVFDFNVEYRTIEGTVTGEPRDPERGHMGSRVNWRVPLTPRVLATGYRFADRDGAFQLHSVPIGQGFVKRTGEWTPVVIGPFGATSINVE